MYILGIETSCDETGAALIKAASKDKPVTLLANNISTSLALHAKTGGIIPEIAARQQIKYIIPVIQKTLKDASISSSEIDAIAVTYGPGLIGSLLVGVETAKTLSFVWNKPIIPINHLIGHIYANWVSNSKLKAQNSKLNAEIIFPAIALVVSGGHTDLVFIKTNGEIKHLGGTRDDAAGECFDKCARLLGYPYPGGPKISKLAEKGDPKAFNFPRPMIDSNDYDFSFSGLKTSFLRKVHELKTKTIGQLNNETIAHLSASLEQAIVDVLITKTIKAAKEYRAKSILLSGGVAANEKLKETIKLAVDSQLSTLNSQLHVPRAHLCTDNAAMIAAAAFYNFKPVPWQKITANPELYFD